MALPLSGCWSVKVKSSVKPETKTRSTLEWHFLWGFTPGNVRTGKCEGGIATAEYKIPWWSGAILFPITFGLVSATHVKWQCVDPAEVRKFREGK